MKAEDLMIWRELPAGRQRTFFQVAALAALGVSAVVWMFLYSATGQAAQRSTAARESYAKVAAMAQEASTLEARTAALASLSPIAATQQIAREMGLDKRLSSVRPAQIGGGQDGAQLLFEGLNLPELVNLLGNLKNRGGLRTVSCSISHRMDVPDLADLQLVVVR
jgi:hypothetical protein